MGTDGYIACDKCQEIVHVGDFFSQHIDCPKLVKAFLKKHCVSDYHFLVYTSNEDDVRFCWKEVNDYCSGRDCEGCNGDVFE